MIHWHLEQEQWSDEDETSSTVEGRENDEVDEMSDDSENSSGVDSDSRTMADDGWSHSLARNVYMPYVW